MHDNKIKVSCNSEQELKEPGSMKNDKDKKGQGKRGSRGPRGPRSSKAEETKITPTAETPPVATPALPVATPALPLNVPANAPLLSTCNQCKTINNPILSEIDDDASKLQKNKIKLENDRLELETLKLQLEKQQLYAIMNPRSQCEKCNNPRNSCACTNNTGYNILLKPYESNYLKNATEIYREPKCKSCVAGSYVPASAG